MPQGKPAGVPCVQLDDALRCRLFGKPERPAFCRTLKPGPDMCGGSRQDAMALLTALERATAPAMPSSSAREATCSAPGT